MQEKPKKPRTVQGEPDSGWKKGDVVSAFCLEDNSSLLQLWYYFLGLSFNNTADL